MPETLGGFENKARNGEGNPDEGLLNDLQRKSDVSRRVQIEVSEHLRRILFYKFGGDESSKAEISQSFVAPEKIDYEEIIKKNPEKSGRYTLNPETALINWNEVSPERVQALAFPEFSEKGNEKSKGELFKYLTHEYPQRAKYLFPGLEYQVYLSDPQNKDRTQKSMQGHTNLNFSLGSVAWDINGDANVPYSKWVGGIFSNTIAKLDSLWSPDMRVVAVERDFVVAADAFMTKKLKSIYKKELGASEGFDEFMARAKKDKLSVMIGSPILSGDDINEKNQIRAKVSRFGEYVMSPDTAGKDWNEVDPNDVETLELPKSFIGMPKWQVVKKILEDSHYQSKYIFPDIGYQMFLEDPKNKNKIPKAIESGNSYYHINSNYRGEKGIPFVPLTSTHDEGKIIASLGHSLDGKWSEFDRILAISKKSK